MANDGNKRRVAVSAAKGWHRQPDVGLAEKGPKYYNDHAEPLMQNLKLHTE